MPDEVLELEASSSNKSSTSSSSRPKDCHSCCRAPARSRHRPHETIATVRTRLRRGFGRQCDDKARVQPAGKHGAKRDLAHEPRPPPPPRAVRRARPRDPRRTVEPLQDFGAGIAPVPTLASVTFAVARSTQGLKLREPGEQRGREIDVPSIRYTCIAWSHARRRAERRRRSSARSRRRRRAAPRPVEGLHSSPGAAARPPRADAPSHTAAANCPRRLSPNSSPSRSSRCRTNLHVQQLRRDLAQR